ncbi:sporulation integral membrane protein YlbJ [Bacillus sp. FJAT-47783]|uniref:sporulation integral membrane protein YlbJ n=1 Tax=Bacillus sp. FJAT-47783 TaxID=2922712 RepID=UPI001FAD66EC|nr:sporulation integral membrane protein YlbJ [Bacillus sp. FJAT-47783]
MKRSLWNTIFLALFFSIFALLIVLFPKEALEASKNGLHMWWHVVFPSLLPFFIVSELLIGYGVVRFIGVLLEPLMRPLFRVPGVGGFVWAMGMASGFPAGAKFTARLRQEKQITAIEAERLVSFTNCSNPLFIFAAVSVGFFKNEQLGLLLITSHYLSNFFVGIMMRFYGRKQENIREKKTITFPSITKALRALHHFQRNEVKPLGKMLGDAVTHSIQTLLMIGGFIILFSVLNKMLSLIHVTQFLGSIVASFILLFDFPTTLGVPLISGLFEITLGSKLTSDTDGSILQQAMIVSFILAFSGFSVQAQVASILAETDIKFYPFFFARIAQGVLAAILTNILFHPLYVESTFTVQHVIPVLQRETSVNWLIYIWNQVIEIGPVLTLLAILLYIYLFWHKYKTKPHN